MSESPKKPAGRDISDLKARLGLKKGAEGGAPGAPGPASRPTMGIPAQGAPIPPPAGKIGGGFVPPPPGVAPPPSAAPVAPPEPALPDASVDPFGAMNAMAQQGVRAVAANPEFVIVNDGRPVEQVAEGKKFGWVKLAAMMAAPLLVGLIVGGINERNKFNNAGIDGAKALYADFENVAKSLVDVQNAFDGAKDRGMKPFDKQLVADLDGLKLTQFNKQTVFTTNYSGVPLALTEQVFTFYSEVESLFALVNKHKEQSKKDLQKQVPKGNVGQYAVVLRIPQGDKAPPPYAEVVELGAPICAGDSKPSEQGCSEANPPERFQVRPDPQSGWATLPWARSGDKVAQDAIVQIGDSKVWGAFLLGAPQYVDMIGYTQRMQEIQIKLEKIAEMRTSLQSRLNVLAQEGKSFAL